MYDRDSFHSDLDRLLGTRPEVKIASAEEQLRKVKDFSVKAAVLASDLTGRPEWDTFLAWVQERREVLAEEKVGLMDALADRSRSDPSSLISIKLDLVYAQGQADALDWAVGLPKAAIENAKSAL